MFAVHLEMEVNHNVHQRGEGQGDEDPEIVQV